MQLGSPTEQGRGLLDWYDAAEGQCHHGIAANVTFNLGHTILPDKVIYDIQSNTSDYGNPPYGDGTACHATPRAAPTTR